jgi:hypothetical protein
MKADRTQTPENTNDGVGKLNKYSYRDGCLQPIDLEEMLLQENGIIHKKKSVTRLAVGIALATIISLVGGTTFLLTQDNQPSSRPEQTTPAHP